MTVCRWDRDAKAHLTRTHLPECATVDCPGCEPCTEPETEAECVDHERSQP